MVKANNKSKFIKFFCIVLTLVSLFTISPVTASAKTTTSSKQCVSFNINNSAATKCYHTYYINGSTFCKKSVQIVGSVWVAYKSAAKTYKSLARFDVKVHDKNGKLKSEVRNLKIGDSFKLPRGNQKYTIYICSYFSGYNKNNTNHQSAAIAGTFSLKY